MYSEISQLISKDQKENKESHLVKIVTHKFMIEWICLDFLSEMILAIEEDILNSCYSNKINVSEYYSVIGISMHACKLAIYDIKSH